MAFVSQYQVIYQNTGSSDPIMSASGLLMLSYHTSPSQMRANTYWLGLAIYTAREAQAYSYEDCRHSIQQKRTLKRLWWSCILRDRVVSLGVRRPLFITSADFDFSLPPLTADDLFDDTNAFYFYSTGTRQSLAMITEHTCGLASALTDTLMLVMPRKEPFLPTSEGEARRCLKQVDTCLILLNHWRDEAWPAFEKLERIDEAHRSLHLYISITNLYYQ